MALLASSSAPHCRGARTGAGGCCVSPTRCLLRVRIIAARPRHGLQAEVPSAFQGCSQMQAAHMFMLAATCSSGLERDACVRAWATVVLRPSCTFVGWEGMVSLPPVESNCCCSATRSCAAHCTHKRPCRHLHCQAAASLATTPRKGAARMPAAAAQRSARCGGVDRCAARATALAYVPQGTQAKHAAALSTRSRPCLWCPSCRLTVPALLAGRGYGGCGVLCCIRGVCML